MTGNRRDKASEDRKAGASLPVRMTDDVHRATEVPCLSGVVV